MNPIAQSIAGQAPAPVYPVINAPANAAPNTFTPEEIAQLESEYRRIGVIPSEHGDYALVIRSAKRVEWNTFKKRVLDDDIREKADAQVSLVSSCCIAVKYRGRSAFAQDARKLLEEVLDDYPAMPDQPPVTALIKTLNGDVGGARSGK